jgi:hypothetical protein
MKNHLKEIVDECLKFNPKYILDIGCNDGFMLKQYPSNVKKVGIDPSDIANEIKEDNIEVINECFPSKNLDRRFDIITSIACFYDINEPVEFCKEIEKLLIDVDGNCGIWAAEFAYLPAVLKNLAYDGMVHEHVALYSLTTFEHILNRTGLKLIKAVENDTNGGSLQVWVTKKNNSKFDNKENLENIIKLKIKEFDMALDDLDTYQDFAKRVYRHSSDLYELLRKLKKEGKKIHILGMSTKLNTILNFCRVGPETIDFAAERSPEKWGAATVSGIPMISEEESRAMKPDVYLVGPYHFKREILEREQETIKNGTKFLFPLPDIEMI